MHILEFNYLNQQFTFKVRLVKSTLMTACQTLAIVVSALMETTPSAANAILVTLGSCAKLKSTNANQTPASTTVIVKTSLEVFDAVAFLEPPEQIAR